MATIAEVAAVLNTTEKNVKTRAVKMRLTPVCSRCGGCGHYSYNQMTGTTCFGCNGYGVATLTEKNAAFTLANAREAVAAGKLETYLAGLKAQQESKNGHDRMFAAWKPSLAAKGNPHHGLRDAECTAAQLACRNANSRIARAYDVASNAINALNSKSAPEAYTAANEALKAFFAVVAETDKELGASA